MSLKEVLQHPWITRDLKAVSEARRHSVSISEFELYTLTQPDIIINKSHDKINQ